MPGVDCRERGMICREAERGEEGRGGGWEYREGSGNGEEGKWQKDSESEKCSSGRIEGTEGRRSGTTCQQGVDSSRVPRR